MATNLKPQVLVVDDAQIAQKAAKLMLMSLGCEVDIAANAADAIACFKAKPYNLIFMDLGLPDMNGITTAQIIRELEIHKPFTPIIILTAHSDEQTKDQVKNVKILDEYLVKPLTMDCARAIIQKYCNSPCAT